MKKISGQSSHGEATTGQVGDILCSVFISENKKSPDNACQLDVIDFVSVIQSIFRIQAKTTP